MSNLVYLDHHATTPCDPRVVEAMLPFFTKHYGNPSSMTHIVGSYAAAAVEAARAQVATLFDAESAEIIFTSGATESNNIAILGAAQQHEAIGGTRRRIVTTAVEHRSVIGPCRRLAESCWDVVVLPVDRTGMVDLSAAEKTIDDNTLLISIQAANHELGTIQPVQHAAQLAHEHGALVHCDAAQAAGKIPLDAHDLNIDLLSFSGHKLYGPKGIGALWIRGGPGRLPLRPLSSGGGQESLLRPGTLNVPAIVGLGVACSISAKTMTAESQQICALRDTLEKSLSDNLPGLLWNGNVSNRLPGSSSVTFPGIDADALLSNLPDLAISTGSACESGALEPSRVLLAIGLTVEEAFSTLRLSLGRFTTFEDIKKVTSQVTHAYYSYIEAL